MALSTCTTCKKDLATSAPTCPHCGEKYPHGPAAALAEASAPMLGIGLGFVILLMFLTGGC